MGHTFVNLDHLIKFVCLVICRLILYFSGIFACVSMFDCVFLVIMLVWKALLLFVGAIHCCKCGSVLRVRRFWITTDLGRLRSLEHCLVSCWCGCS